MKKKNNIAWRPENRAEAKKFISGNAAFRQDQLDPSETEVDEYDPLKNPTGDDEETSDQRHDNAKVGFNLLYVGIAPPC